MILLQPHHNVGPQLKYKKKFIEVENEQFA